MSSLYEVCDLFSFTLNERTPKIFISPTKETVCVLNSSKLNVFKQNSTNSISQSILEFDDILVAAGISDDGSLVATCDVSGSLHFVYPSLDIVLYSQKILRNDNVEFISLEFTKTEEGSCKLFVLTSTNVLHVFQNILIDKLNEAMQCGNTDIIQKVKNSLCTLAIDLSEFHEHHVTSISTFNNFFVSFGNGLLVWDVDKDTNNYDIIDEVTFLLQGATIVKSMFTTDCKFMICLTDNSMITVWLMELLIMINSLSEVNVTDFSVTSLQQQSNDVLCCVVDEYINIYSVPDLLLCHSVSVCSPLLTCGWPSEGVLCFAEICSDCNNETVYLTLKTLIQIQPEQKLDKLVSLEKFTEAYEIATQYGLDTQIVSRKRALYLNDSLLSTDVSCDDKLNEMCSELVNVFDEIEDLQFSCELVLGSVYPSFDCTHNLLLYIKNRLGQFDSCSLREKVYTMLNKLVTYKLITPKYSVSTWRSFSQNDISNELFHYIKSGDVKLATQIWKRHHIKLTQNQLLALLNELPINLSSSDLGLLIVNYILPYFLQHFQEHLDSFGKWLIERVVKFETVEETQWPTNAINLMETIIKLINNNRKWEEQVSLQAEQTTASLSVIQTILVTKLEHLCRQLNDLQFIKTQLNLSLTFSDFQKETRESVVFKLLDKCIAPETIPSLLETSIKPYVEYHSLSLDTVLLHYLKFALNKVSMLSPDSQWEAKTVTIVRSIHDKEIQVDGCVQLLQRLQRTKGSLPNLSTLVETLIHECLSFTSNCVQYLRKQYDLLQLRYKLFSYGITDFNYDFSNDTIAWGYVRYILKQDNENVLTDSLQVAELYGLNDIKVYVFHLINLGLNDKSWKIIDILSELSVNKSVIIANKIIILMSTALENEGQYLIELYSEEMKQKYFSPHNWKSNIETALECLKFLSLNGIQETIDGENVCQLIKLLKIMKNLQMEFNECYSISVMKNSTKCLSLVQKRFSNFFPPANDTVSNVRQYLRYGSLMGVAKTQLYQDLLIHLLNTNETDDLITLSKDFVSDANCDSVGVVKVLVAMVMRVWSLLREEDQLSSSIGCREIEYMSEISSAVVQLTNNDNLLFCLEISRLSNYLKWVWSQSNSTYDSNQKKISVPISELYNVTHFRESGMIIELGIIPLVVTQCYTVLHCLKSNGICTNIPAVSSTAPIDDIDTLSKEVLQLVSCFRDNGHCELVMKTIFYFVMNCMFLNLSLQNELIETFNSIVFHMKDKLTQKVLTSSKIDHIYGLSLLLNLPVDRSILKYTECKISTLTSYTKIKSLCYLAIDFGLIVCNPQIVETSRYFLKSACWGKKLRQHQISFIEAFRGKKEQKTNILTKMFETQSVDLDMITEYCSDYKIELHGALMMYIKLIITKWSSDQAVLRLEEVLNKLTNQIDAFNLLEYLLNKVSPYDYSKIELIIKLLSKNEQRQQKIPINLSLQLLDCLRAYTRHTPLANSEREWLRQWSIKSSVSSCQYIESPSVLPFHLFLFNYKSVITDLLSSELTKDSLGQLSSICAVIELPFDDVLEESIKKIVKHSFEEQLVKFEYILPLLKEIANPKTFIDLVKWLSSELTNIEAIKCLKFAINTAIQRRTNPPAELEENGVSIVNCVDEFKKLLQVKQTEMILNEARLHDDTELLSLVSQPVQLVLDLYTKYSLSKSVEVHEIVEKLKNVWELNMTEIRHTLAEEWLPVCSTVTTNDMDITQLSIMEDPTAPSNLANDEGESDEEETEDELCLRRLSYLMKLPTELELNVKYLLNWSKVLGGTQSRIKAFKVLFSIAPIEMIERINGTSINEIKEYVQMVLFISELESLHINTTINNFQSCNKESLIKSLWKNHLHEPRGIRLICELCLYYKLYDPSLWSKLLDQLIHLNMIPYLRYLLKCLIQLPLLWEIHNIVSIWYKTMIIPLKEVSIPLTSHQIKEYTKSLELLEMCPFICDIDVIELSRTYHSIGMLVQSVLCVILLPNNGPQYNNYIEEVIDSLNDIERTSLISDYRH